MTEEDKKTRLVLSNKVAKFQEEGICPTCHNMKYGDIYVDEGLIFYEDEKIICLFEKYARFVGHTIILSKKHYEDISFMPTELGTHILKVSNKVIELLKEVLGAEKVYMCTMCDGKRNHLHFQLLPRLNGDTIGSKNFVKKRGVIVDYYDTVKIFRERLKGCII